jgi:UDP-N-acetylmuramoylalanine--D-glutamate ligase
MEYWRDGEMEACCPVLTNTPILHYSRHLFFMNVRGKHILVVGLGKSGLSVVRWLAKNGARVTVSEIKAESELDPRVLREIVELRVGLEAGGHRKETFLLTDGIIVSPGVPLDMGPLAAAKEKGIPVLGEMELACRLTDTPMVGITGTNGKSTVTALVGAMLQRAGTNVFVGGNIGTPLIDYAAGEEKADYAVVEVSSFQLDTMTSFHPRVAILLNISPDHLDRYMNYEAYVRSKLIIFQNQAAGDWAVLNDDDPALAGFIPREGVAVLRYGSGTGENRQGYLEGKTIRASLPGEEMHEFVLDQCSLQGDHNRENVMAAVLAGLALHVRPFVIQQTLDTFRGLPHRLEFVRRIRDVDFYDDSKATNVDAALRSVASFDSPVVLIGGGRDKGGDYLPLVQAAKGRVRRAVLLGESRFLMAKAFEGIIPYSMAGDMQDAVAQAFSSAMPNDVVLLAPACSSFDMFTDYAHRGRVFKEAVERLGNG